ncbi:MAG: zinc ribbon domain-containing protein [Actinomycetota bacterium]|nr:zinc ribbon domain-containing protein [Actinomycetota bacterium]
MTRGQDKKIEVTGNNNTVAGRDVNIAIAKPVSGPYMVSCPNCGRSISAEADSCLDCGHPVKKHLQKEQYKKAQEAVLKICLAFTTAFVILEFLVLHVRNGIWKNYLTLAVVISLFFALLYWGFFHLFSEKAKGR